MYKVKRLDYKHRIENLAKHTIFEVRNIALDYLIENSHHLGFSVKSNEIDKNISMQDGSIVELLYECNINYTDKNRTDFTISIRSYNTHVAKKYYECKLIINLKIQHYNRLLWNINNEFIISEDNNDFLYKIVDIERWLVNNMFALLESTSI
jgi:hypothetical protein